MNNDLSIKILSDLTAFMKYAKYDSVLKRKETWDELVTRNKQMHIKKFPELKNEINEAYKLVYEKKILPSMRSMQFAGKPIEISPNRIYNCAYIAMDDWRAFPEITFLLLGGTGMGISVQRHHVEKLPIINKPNTNRLRRYLIGDSIEGWADAIKVLMKSYFFGGSTIDFDFRDIRQKGQPLITSGGKAPGPQPLKECILKIKGILDHKENGEQLTTLEVYDIMCHIADAVLAGGIRRAALIALFSVDDDDMLTCKYGNWWELNPQRGRSNNSAVLLRHKITKEYFMNLWEKIKASGTGEPGFVFSNDKEYGMNPCLSGDSLITVKDRSVINNEMIIGEGVIYQIPLKMLVDKYEKGEDLPLILTLNEKTNKLEIDNINLATLTKKNATLIEIELENGKKLKLTPDHKVYTKNRGYVEAGKLTDECEILILLNNFKEEISKIQKITKISSEDVYDINCDKNHNFFANGILVHNCAEISLRSCQFCNLVEVNVSDVSEQEELNSRVKAASFIATLQASYTDFHYLRSVWKRTTEKDALIGVGMTGIASEHFLSLNLTEAAEIVKNENSRVAKIIGINPAARCTTVKPSGTTSLILGSSSGVHAWYDKYYIRRMRVGKNESIYKYLAETNPELVVDEYFRPHDTAVIEIPQKAPEGAILRSESIYAFLSRIRKMNIEWVRGGHRKGENYNNVSATVFIKDNEWEFVGEWMWENRDNYTGISVLPYDGGNYKQAPFETITEEEFNEKYKYLHDIDLSQVKEIEDNGLANELACTSGSCEITSF